MPQWIPDYEKTRRIGVAADHAGFAVKQALTARLQADGWKVIDFGNRNSDPVDDYPDFVIPLARATANGEVDRGIAVCGSGVGACVAANKVKGVRACLITDPFTARQGVEDDDLNLICLAGRAGERRAWDLVRTFLDAHFSREPRHMRRLAKVMNLEAPGSGHSRQSLSMTAGPQMRLR